ncbi:FOIE GRAS [Ceraceosorus bombacis]|uniref:FOIE GRAS n=1 Tax=Ceraceosorus bombacis TaxID=401625 RepID=A0A0P1BH96_9BASI|nr:FOIE GRAS [Ceraceosorus bombacis]
MNAYPPDLLSHHYPVLILSGIVPPLAGPKGRVEHAGTSAATNAPPSLVPPTTAYPQLCADLRALVATRGRDTPWDPARAKSTAFKTLLVDSNHRLPVRKSRPLPRGLTAPPSPTDPDDAQSRAHSVLAAQPARSPLSPAHPASPLWPDGIMTPLWLRRHREQRGAVWVMVAVLPTLSNKAASTQNTEDRATAEHEQVGVASDAQQLKETDEALIKVIAERKRTMSERGIKLTVVLLTEREMLESSTLEPRLSHIRRSSSLDSKASLFVLTPVGRSDLSAFLTSLHNALHSNAIDYYAEQARRVRRKRSRYPPNTSAVFDAMRVIKSGTSGSADLPTPPLSKDGWIVRNEYKLGTFLELSGDVPTALTHYAAAYAGLLELLRSTAALPPRTKRWAEAKVLADALSLRISRLCLYDDRPDDASTQFAQHLGTFGELSAGWGMGAESAEWWSWVGKQYRLMGDLTDLSLRASQLPALPQMVPPLPAHLSKVPFVPLAQSRGPAACWYAAGLCAEERRQRFKRMNEVESTRGSDLAAATGGWSVLEHEKKVDHAGLIAEAFLRSDELAKRAGFTHTAPLLAVKIAEAQRFAGASSQAVNFLESVVEQYPRDEHHALVEVLEAMADAALDMQDTPAQLRALVALLSPGVQLDPTAGAERGQRLGALLSGLSMKDDASEVPHPQPQQIQSGSSDGLFSVEASFMNPQADLGSFAHFQVRIAAPRTSFVAGVPVERLMLWYDEQKPPIVLTHDSSIDQTSQPTSQVLKLDEPIRVDDGQTDESSVTAACDLRWSPGSLKVIQGSFIAQETPRTIRFLRAQINTLPTNTALQLHFSFAGPQHYSEPAQPVWYSALSGPRDSSEGVKASYVYLAHADDPASVIFRRRPHRVDVKIDHPTVAFLDDATPVDVAVTNQDDESLHCTVDAVIAPAPAGTNAALIAQATRDVLFVTPETAQTHERNVRDMSLGILQPRETKTQRFFVRTCGHAAHRFVDVFVRSIPPASLESASLRSPGGTPQPHPLTFESSHSVTLDARAMFTSTHGAAWREPRDAPQELSRTPTRNHFLEASDSTIGDESSDGGDSFNAFQVDSNTSHSTVANVTSCLHILGEQKILISSVALELDPGSTHLRLDKSDISEAAQTITDDEWSGGDRWGTVHEIEVLNRSAAEVSNARAGHEATTSSWSPDGTVRPTGVLAVAWRRLDADEAPTSRLNLTRLPIPALLPPHLTARLLVASPPVALLDQPFVMLFTVVNPSPTLTADVFVGLDSSEVFLLAGPRTLSIPNLVPRSTRSVPVRVVARAEGRFVLPRVRAWDRRPRFYPASTKAATKLGHAASASIVSQASANAAPTSANNARGSDEYGSPSPSSIPREMGGEEVGAQAIVMNERAGFGIPLKVKWRPSTGSGISSGGQRALKAEHQNGGLASVLSPSQLAAEQSGTALSILVHRQVA